MDLVIARFLNKTFIVTEQIGIIPEDMDLLKEGNSEEHRESNSSKSNIQ